GLFNLLRNEGGSFGIALGTTMIERRSQFHQFRLVENIHSANPHVSAALGALSDGAVDSVAGAADPTSKPAFAVLYRLIIEQARMMSYLDVLWLFAVFTALIVPLVFLMRRSVARDALVIH
ncbi:MAG TPA: hypothetical protein VFW87_04775, partial [Pirellulales bacterium]|nr:hypothetical protein [Pirellulales bacterium]